MLLHNLKTDKSHLDVTENARESQLQRKMVDFSIKLKYFVKQNYRASNVLKIFHGRERSTCTLLIEQCHFRLISHNNFDKIPNDSTCQICSQFLIKTQKTKKMITRFSRKFHVPNTFISFLARKSLTLGILLGHFGWIFTVRFGWILIAICFRCFAYRLNSRVYAFFKVVWRSHHHTDRFSSITIVAPTAKIPHEHDFFYKIKTANDEEKNANHRQLLVAHIYREWEIHTSCGSIKFNTLVSRITT